MAVTSTKNIIVHSLQHVRTDLNVYRTHAKPVMRLQIHACLYVTQVPPTQQENNSLLLPPFRRMLQHLPIELQHAQERGCDRNSLRPAMRGERDSLAGVRNSSRWQRSSVFGPLGDNPTCIQGLKVRIFSKYEPLSKKPKLINAVLFQSIS
ncbi:hypothetical protein K0M31_005659 [Melipona bicolor]|uniref:Uncharacterized protein n=1 Tax=Melipona bicolor TaxID=60889 RepID=A0AA40FU59_9HYME|nr:hypothetical protein K0M31_005659 [Melipona bicolor]